ncbi:hypothetical protein CK203_025755 [Vitis vinifera]|uniref:Reverse transcriptase zinc-binding domain-containing protein n=1 Tax=Vitis vinifera TaxID=29760 RepID=A0A438IHA4_VITVI|nr:hypothetical protein CK203_025755 [Vitis vinifera]
MKRVSFLIKERMNGDKLCCLCMNKKELANHVLIHCGKDKVVWHLIFSLFIISYGLPKSMM